MSPAINGDTAGLGVNSSQQSLQPVISADDEAEAPRTSRYFGTKRIQVSSPAAISTIAGRRTDVLVFSPRKWVAYRNNDLDCAEGLTGFPLAAGTQHRVRRTR